MPDYIYIETDKISPLRGTIREHLSILRFDGKSVLYPRFLVIEQAIFGDFVNAVLASYAEGAKYLFGNNYKFTDEEQAAINKFLNRAEWQSGIPKKRYEEK